MSEIKQHEIPFERVLFFSDAIVAIAITLLALDLRIEVPDDRHIIFHDLFVPWKKYLAFVLSFINIATFWRTHHLMYTFIHKMNNKTMSYNIGWLFFIVTLPFATSVLSTHFGDAPAVFLYSMNIFALAVFQNMIWDASDFKDNLISPDDISESARTRFRLMFNFDMGNALLCVLLSFLFPKVSFFLLFFKIPIWILIPIYNARKFGSKRKIQSLNKS
ncbi:MAG: TMEM175 family protein [Agriterribacter sp.]